MVDPAQIGGVNAYNLEIARRRARTLIEHTIDLLTNHMVNPQYPSIVFALGGDMFSGDIHEEFMVTNEREVIPTFLDVFEVLVWCIETLADQYKRVFILCVTGNHGRNTHKIRSKGRNFTNFDWLLYQLLARHFERDTRIRFSIPDGPDCLYKIYGHRYLLTHGDQFRGSDALSAVVRGDHKKRNRNNQINMEYDTMIYGHFHTLIQLQRLIVNGCFPAGSLVTLANGTK
jgi:predicted phosphodiesterase